jgi:hypothetical protein
VARFPARRVARPLGRVAIPLRIIDLMIFTCNLLRPPVSDALVKFLGLMAQFIAAVVLVSENTSPQVYVPLGVAVLIFGLIEGGMGVWRAW